MQYTSSLISMLKACDQFKNTVIAISCCVLMASSVAMAEVKKDEGDGVMEFFRGEPQMGYPAPQPLLVNANAREYQSLNGLWNFFLDESGMSWGVITKSNYYPDRSMTPGVGMPYLKERTFDSRRQLQVPGDWNSQIPELDRYRSRVVYQKSLDIEPEADKRYFIHFGGANYTTDLFVNNQLVGRHIGGYTAFNFDITEFIKAGHNELIVRVNAHLDESSIPTMSTSDFWKYGGLTRDVGLVVTPETYIEQYHVYLPDHKKSDIKGWVQVQGKELAKQKVTLSIPKAGIKTVVTTNAKGRAEFSMQAKKLSLWSPESPALYDVYLSHGKEKIKDRIGFRTIKTDGLNILLNGEAIKLRGISMHEETTLHPGLSHSREDVKAMFKLVKELNANFVRLAHYPHSEHAVKLADEMGLLLWSEVPIVSLIDWENSETLAAAKGQVTDNISRDLNRASIAMWSVSNESFPETHARLDFLTALAELARELDESQRPIASALFADPRVAFTKLSKYIFIELLQNPKVDAATKQRLMAMAAKSQSGASGAKGSGDQSDRKAATADEAIDIVIEDPLGDVVDIIGYNEYFGWYYSGFLADNIGVDEMLVRDAMMAVMHRIRFSNAFGKPMIISEFGAGAKQGLRSEEALIWSEEYQAKVYEAQLNMLPKSPYVQGFSPWVLKDFRSHLRELNGIHGTYNRKGLVSETGEKKLAFDVLADFYRSLKEAK